MLMLVFVSGLVDSSARADDNPADSKIDLKKIKEDQETQVQVVQNRTFSRSGKVEFGILGGAIMTDPFISVFSAGGKLGYNFSDLFKLQALVWRDFVKESSSGVTFSQDTSRLPDSNYPEMLYAGEFVFSPIYGKLDFLNLFIMYCDLHIGVGAGDRVTQSGPDLAYIVNVGEEIFLSQHFSFNFDYRMLIFQQTILDKFDGSNAVLGKPYEMSNVFTIGFSVLF